ncbi:MAG: hypothetical protein Fur0046_24690 [Cyanobacteria bacterium J069]
MPTLLLGRLHMSMSILTPIRKALDAVFRAGFSWAMPAKEHPDLPFSESFPDPDSLPELLEQAGDRPSPLAKIAETAEIAETALIEQEIRMGRTVSLADLIGQAGRGLMTGESPVPRLMQARTAVCLFIDRHLADSSGVLQAVLKAQVQTDEAHLSRWLDAPLGGLAEILDSYLDNETLHSDLVQRVKMTWGEWSGDRPRFQSPSQPPHPDDEYAPASVRDRLVKLRSRVLAEIAGKPDATADADTEDRLAGL